MMRAWGRIAAFAFTLGTLCVVVYWQALHTWFHMDDFAWLGMPADVRQYGLWEALFAPRAQGTLRPLSERLYFLGLSVACGLDYRPFKAVIFGTQCVNLVLVAAIARRLTGSTPAAFVAGAAWAFNSALAVPMAWASAYNQLLWTLALLASFFFLIRYTETGKARYNLAQWITFLLGFGALEFNAVYPALAILYTALLARPYLKRTLPLLIPSVVFAAAHFALVPRSNHPIYSLYFDSALPATLLHYAEYGFRPYGLLLIALCGFAIYIRRPLAWFLLAWFAIVLAPVLPLKNHITDYYLTAAVIGPSILAGQVATATAVPVRIAAWVILAVHCAAHYRQTQQTGEWRYRQSHRLRHYLEQVDTAYRRNPRRLLLLSGVDWDLFSIGFNDEPFRLYGIRRTRLTPGSEARFASSAPLRGIEKYTIPAAEAAREAAANEVLVLSLVRGRISDVTAAFKTVSQAQAAGVATSVDAGSASSVASLGEGWFPIEQGFRWMGPRAALRLGAPGKTGGKLVVTGYCPAAVVAAGPVRLTIAAGGRGLGTVEVSKPDQPFRFEFELPKTMGLPLNAELSVNRPTTLPDGRTVGLVFGTFAIE
jgi:hypothetical protein